MESFSATKTSEKNTKSNLPFNKNDYYIIVIFDYFSDSYNDIPY